MSGEDREISVRNFRQGCLLVRDGSGVANELIITAAEGDLNFKETDTTFVVKNRGKIAGRSQGDEDQMTVSFTIKFEQWSFLSGESDGVSPRDALKGEYGASDWVSTAPCGPYSVDLIYQIEDVCGTGGIEELTFPRFHADTVTFDEGDEFNTLKVEGTCLASKPIRAWIN